MKKITDIVCRGRFDDSLLVGTISIDGSEPTRVYDYYLDDNINFANLLIGGSVNIDFIRDDELADSVTAEFGD